jgi:hypothetical protein
MEVEGLVATGTANDTPAPLVPCLQAAAPVEADSALPHPLMLARP